MSVSVDRSESLSVNLTVLQRIDKDIVEIMATASHVALYAYDPAAQNWEKRNVEGAFFFVKRAALPTYRMIITNRLNPTIFVQDITTDVQFQFKKPYLMWKSKQASEGSSPESISSIWFHSEDDLKAVGRVLSQILKEGRDKAATTSAGSAAPVTTAAATPALSIASSSSSSSSSSGSDAASASSKTGGLTASASSNSLTPSVAAFFNAFASATGSGTPVSQGSSSSSSAPSATARIAPVAAAPQPAPVASSAGGALGLGLGSALLAGIGAAPAPASAAPVSSSSSSSSSASSAAAAAGLGDVSIMLSKKQLQALLMDLLSTDDEFVASLHRKYLEGVTRRALMQQ